MMCPSLPVHLVLAPVFGGVRIAHVLLVLCVFSFISQCFSLYLSPFSLLRLCPLSFGFRFNRGYPWFYFHLVTTEAPTVDLEFIFHFCLVTAGNRHKQNSWFCKEIREDNFRFWWRIVHEDASQGMYMSKIEICFSTARILQNQRMLCCGECFHD